MPVDLLDDILAGRQAFLLKEPHHCRGNQVVEPHDRTGVVLVVLQREIRGFLIAEDSAVVCSMAYPTLARLKAV